MTRKSLSVETVLGKIYVKGLEETAFLFEVFRLPKLGRKQEELIRRLYCAANVARRELGKKPRRYKTVRKRKVVKI